GSYCPTLSANPTSLPAMPASSVQIQLRSQPSGLLLFIGTLSTGIFLRADPGRISFQGPTSNWPPRRLAAQYKRDGDGRIHFHRVTIQLRRLIPPVFDGIQS